MKNLKSILLILAGVLIAAALLSFIDKPKGEPTICKLSNPYYTF